MIQPTGNRLLILTEANGGNGEKTVPGKGSANFPVASSGVPPDEPVREEAFGEDAERGGQDAGTGTFWWGEATDEPAREDARPTKNCKRYHYRDARVPQFLVPQGQFQKHLHTLTNPAKLLHKQDFRDGNLGI